MPSDHPSDLLRVCAEEELTSDGFRLVWFHSRRKASLDDMARGDRCRKAIQDLEQLQRRLSFPRTRFRERSAVERSVHEILAARRVDNLLKVEIIESEQESFRKEGRGRPNEHST